MSYIAHREADDKRHRDGYDDRLGAWINIVTRKELTVDDKDDDYAALWIARNDPENWRRACEMPAKKRDGRKRDNTEGRRHRREIEALAVCRPTRACADEVKRLANAGSARQTRPWEALCISRATYYRRRETGQGPIACLIM